MTGSSEKGLGSGPGGLVLPEDIDDPFARPEIPEMRDEGEMKLAVRMERIERLLEGFFRGVAKSADLMRAEDERRREFVELRGKLSELLCDMARVSRVPGDMASRHALEDVAQTQRYEFAWLRESHAWLRGAITVAVPAQRPRSGVFALWMLSVIGMFAVFAVGAMALGFVSVNVSWTGMGVTERASASRPAPPVMDVVPGVAAPAGGERAMPEEIVDAPAFAAPQGYLRGVEFRDERRARGIRLGRGPEEYLGRREDDPGLQPDVPLDTAP